MARTIGKKNIATVQRLTRVAVNRGEKNVQDWVMDNVDVNVFDIWESAYDEIQRVIWDEIWKDR